VLRAENWIRERHPHKANDVLFTAGLYIDKSGRIKVEDYDLTKMDKSVDRDTGDSFSKVFKAEAANDDKYEGALPPAEANRSRHHIISQEEIETTLTTSRSLPLEDRKAQLEEYVNLPHIQKPLSGLVTATEQRQNLPDDGKKLHSAVLWNPHNVVRGPKPTARGDDPHQLPRPLNAPPIRVDEALLSTQSAPYAKEVDNYLNDPSLKTFGALPKPASATYYAHEDPRKNDGSTKWYVSPDGPKKD